MIDFIYLFFYFFVTLETHQNMKCMDRKRRQNKLIDLVCLWPEEAGVKHFCYLRLSLTYAVLFFGYSSLVYIYSLDCGLYVIVNVQVALSKIHLFNDSGDVCILNVTLFTRKFILMYCNIQSSVVLWFRRLLHSHWDFLSTVKCC